MVVAAVVWKGSTKNGFSAEVVSSVGPVLTLVLSSVVLVVVLVVSSVVLVVVVGLVVVAVLVVVRDVVRDVVVGEVVVGEVVVGEVVGEVLRETLVSGYTWGPPVGSTELSAVFSTA
ncbi:hypothetical protein FBY28_2562 [Arthrobacter sp. SLBN-53]|nr:hypothetical protein FBY28_2562 [Arthrobacter sp. SLBN-53]